MARKRNRELRPAARDAKANFDAVQVGSLIATAADLTRTTWQQGVVLDSVNPSAALMLTRRKPIWVTGAVAAVASEFTWSRKAFRNRWGMTNCLFVERVALSVAELLPVLPRKPSRCCAGPPKARQRKV